jgi:DNA (cytosine-5)-methyltransferase 1
MSKGLIVDSFCGFGGFSRGCFQALGRSPDIAINHDPDAIRIHSLNHPGAVHYANDVFQVQPFEATGGQEVELLWASPACTHFSRARGSAPVSKQTRDLSWVVVKWVREVRPAVVCVENVAEMLSWKGVTEIRDAKGATVLGKDGCPLMTPDPAQEDGVTFREWCRAITQEGYSLDWKVLNAADFGAATCRLRLVIIARRDGTRITWPKPTHSRSGRHGLKKWVPTASIVDWSIPTPSIFGRKKDLVPKSADRVARGLLKYVLNAENPYLAPAQANGANNADLVVPWICRRFGGMTASSVDVPFPTITTVGTQNVLACAKLKQAPSDDNLVSAFMVKYYSQGGQHAVMTDPCPTIPTKARMGLVQVTLNGQTFTVTDIGMRMLTARELARAQGFPDSYVLAETTGMAIKQIGNSVVPAMAEAVVRSQLKPGKKAA